VVDRQSPERGLIWERLHTSDAELQMPPADSGRTLSGAAGDPRSLAARGARRDSRTGPFARPGRLPCRASPDRPGRATRSTLSWSTDCRVSRWHRPRRRAARPVGAAVPRAAASRRRTDHPAAGAGSGATTVRGRPGVGPRCNGHRRLHARPAMAGRETGGLSRSSRRGSPSRSTDRAARGSVN
jgi:hypothetical protein